VTTTRRWLRPLSHPWLYATSQRALGSETARTHFVEEHLRPRPGERILDLGCGPAQILGLLPEVDYVGIDLSQDYLEAARRRHGSRGAFLHGDVRLIDGQELGRFDAVVAFGLLHHLDDHSVLDLLGRAAGLLGPAGRMSTLDPARWPGQPRVARWLIDRDRGRHIRSSTRYGELARAHFPSVSIDTHHHLARVGYTQVVLDCHKSRNRAR